MTDHSKIGRNNAPCSIDGCDSPWVARAWCLKHYKRWRNHGTTDLHEDRTALQRFFERVAITGDCWLWTGGTNQYGYGIFSLPPHEKRHSAHRWLYETVYGTLPDGLQIDHLCRTSACVRLDHLEAVTQRENLMRGMGPALFVERMRLRRAAAGG